MPPRKTPLQARAPLQPGTGLTRNPLPRTSPGPARRPLSSAHPKVTPEERRARRLVRVRSGGVCEGCRQARATDYSHRVRRGPGAWCPSNALDLCASCHRFGHAEPLKARDLGWLLRTTDDPLIVPACLFGQGWVLLTPDGDAVPTERSAF